MPFAGDLVGVLLSTYILAEAARLGASGGVLARMALNIAVEGLAGLIPLAGDLFDAAWKANQRNVRLLERWLAEPAPTERASALFLSAICGAILALVALSLLSMVFVLRWIFG